MSRKTAVIIGLHPDAVDYKDPAYAAFPDLTPAKLMAALDKEHQALLALGLDAVMSLWEKKPDSADRFIADLKAHAPDVVLIGAGVRFNPGLTELFETLVNLVRTHAPQARLCFNSGPSDTAAAVLRQIG